MGKRRIAWVLASILLTVGCHRAGPPVATRSSAAPLFDGMGTHQRKTSTSVSLAQRYFDQGLIWTFAFNHDEAIRSYQQAVVLDPDFAMAWWGIALSHGPHINFPIMTPESSKAAWEALQKALSLRENASPVEKELIDALAARYAAMPPADRAPLDQDYATAMRGVWKRNPQDADVGVLYAESMMDLRPWSLWAKNGKPQPGTEEIIAVLDKVLSRSPNHPGALHLHIHALEAARPEKAVASANRLRTLVPASGHLVHMPSHIDVLTGQWEQASLANIKAIETDRVYRELSPRQGFYHIYMAHNHQMLTFSSMMEGRDKAAARSARDMVAGIPEEYAKNNSALVDGMMALPYEALMRFGHWEEVLSEPAPPNYLPIATALWRFSHAVAYAAKGDLPQAETARMQFRQAVAAVPKGAMMAINPAENILKIAGHVLDGEIAYRKGQIAAAEAALRNGIRLEDELNYMEPPEWIQPVRQTLGAILLANGRYAEAEKVYREDLKKWPENGWSLFGLAKSLRARGQIGEADQVQERFNKVWSRADRMIESSCLCVAAK